jgi:translocation and assembly module TamA
LRVYGYYDARSSRSVVTRPVDIDKDGTTEDPPQVRFDIIPGPHYRFGAIDLGALNTAPDYEELRATFEIQSGDFLSSDKIVEEQFDLDRALGETGYAFAEIDAPELLIDHARVEGDLTMEVQPNGKYVFGDVISNKPDFLPGDHLETIARFDEGDIYQRSLENDLRRAITATGLVSSVTIARREIEPPADGQPGKVALDVEMTEAELRTIAGAIGYGSEEGFRVEASWEHRNFFPPEGMVRVRGIAGTQEQLAGLSFRRNNFGGRDRILNIDAYASTIDSPAFDARTAALLATYERISTLLFQKPLSWSAGIELVATQERPPAVSGIVQPRETYFVAALPLYAQIDTTNDLLDPVQGFRLAGRISPEVSRNNGVESFYLRGRADASYYRQVTEKVVLAGRAAYGAIPGTGLLNIAPSRRYYAGGGGSVRGYGYREIGPRDELGEPTGGRSVLELAAEARIRTGLLDGAVSVVPFVDAGTVGTGLTPDFDEFRIGVGVGVRYHTGFGPVRVDLGVPLNPGPDDNPVAVYVSLGQAF